MHLHTHARTTTHVHFHAHAQHMYAFTLDARAPGRREAPTTLLSSRFVLFALCRSLSLRHWPLTLRRQSSHFSHFFSCSFLLAVSFRLNWPGSVCSVLLLSSRSSASRCFLLLARLCGHSPWASPNVQTSIGIQLLEGRKKKRESISTRERERA